MAPDPELSPTSAAAWEARLGPHELVEGREYSVGPFASESLVEWEGAVQRVFSEATRLVGPPTIRTEKRGGALAHWIDVSPLKCGFVGAGGRLIVVKPKLPGVDWLGLLALANAWGDAPAADLGGDEHLDFVLLVVEAYARSLEALTREGLRRWFDEREETLTGHVRGRLMLSRYTRHCAAGRPDRGPCRFPVLDFDNLPNRTLRWALLLARHLLDAAVAGQDASGRHGGLVRRIAALDTQMDGIRLQRLTSGELRPLEKLPASFDHYAPALSIARLLIERLVLVDEPGGARSMSFVFSMPDLFEQAMKAVLGDAWKYHFPHSYEIAGQGSRTGTFVPDFWHKERPAIIDAKWKYAFGAGTADGAAAPQEDLDTVLGVRLAQIRHADVFQLVTYCHIRGALDRVGGVAKGLLIYPVESAVDRVEPTRLLLVAPPDRTVEVALMPWPVGRSKERSIWESARTLRDAVETFLDGAASPTAQTPAHVAAAR